MASNGVHSVSAADRKPPPPLGKQTRKDVDSSFEQFAAVIQASNRPLPNRYGNGSINLTEDKKTGIWTDIGALRQGGFLLESISTLYALVQQKKKGGPVDDKSMIVRCLSLSFYPILHYPICITKLFEAASIYVMHWRGLSLHITR